MSASGKQSLAVITGGSSGIGEATARRLAADGHDLALIDINGRRCADVAADIARTSGVLVRGYSCDVADPLAVDATAAQVEKEMGACGILVASAGLLHSTDALMTMDLADHDRLWRVNYHGTVHTIRSFGRAMERNGGSIVTIGSINSFTPLPLPAYNPSKAAIFNLTQIAAMELGRHNIRVNSVAPTFTMTPALKEKIDKGERNVEAIRRLQAIRLLVEPKHIADAIAFLCSDAAAAITGIMLPIDAGYLAAISYKTYAGGLPWKQ